jgi:GNAT superfamily N-acetyltransferase
MPTLTIRGAGEEDLASVRACLIETWHATYDAIYGLDEVTRITNSWHAIPVLRRQLADTANTFLVADYAGTIAGTALLQVSASDWATLHRLYVCPVHQGQLIGAKLLAACLCAVPSRARVRLEVARANIRAVGFYERNGFMQIDTNITGDTFVYERRAAQIC